MIWLLLFLVLLGFLCWLPMRLEIDTQQQTYQFTWGYIFAIWGIPDEERWRWFIRLFFWKKEWQPFKAKVRKVAKPTKARVAGARKAPISIQRGLSIFRNLYKAFKIKRLEVNWDTGDVLLNAWLYPVLYLASRNGRHLSINFWGIQELAICLQTRPGLLILAVLRAFLSHKQ